MPESIRIKLSERPLEIDAATRLFALRARFKPDADVIVLNGCPAVDDQPLAEGDEVVLIRRGEIPSADELEALMAARHTPGVNDVLRKAAVGIAGLGGLGSSVAVALARSGLGRLVLADYDVVEPTNLNRQQYFVDQIGELKTDAMAANLARINPCVEVHAHHLLLTSENVPGVFGDVDILVEAFDAAAAKAMLVESFAKARPDVPIVMASGVGGYEPGNWIRARRAGRNLTLVGDGETAAVIGVGLMAPRVGIAAHQQANAVVRLLMGRDPIEAS